MCSLIVIVIVLSLPCHPTDTTIETAPGVFMPYVSDGFINDAPVNGQTQCSTTFYDLLCSVVCVRASSSCPSAVDSFRLLTAAHLGLVVQIKGTSTNGTTPEEVAGLELDGYGSVPPGGAPFLDTIMQQPVLGAARGVAQHGWKQGRLCDVTKPPYSARNGSNATLILQQAIDDCGDLSNGGGGTVLVPSALHLRTASLWLLSNLTLRIEGSLVSTATGTGDAGAATIDDAPMVYTRRNSLMVTAHAGMINGGKCLRMKAAPAGGDDCEEWRKLANVVIEGGGTIDGNGDAWYKEYSVQNPGLKNLRPMLLDLYEHDVPVSFCVFFKKKKRGQGAADRPFLNLFVARQQ